MIAECPRAVAVLHCDRITIGTGGAAGSLPCRDSPMQDDPTQNRAVEPFRRVRHPLVHGRHSRRPWSIVLWVGADRCLTAVGAGSSCRSASYMLDSEGERSARSQAHRKPPGDATGARSARRSSTRPKRQWSGGWKERLAGHKQQGAGRPQLRLRRCQFGCPRHLVNCARPGFDLTGAPLTSMPPNDAPRPARNSPTCAGRMRSVRRRPSSSAINLLEGAAIES